MRHLILTAAILTAGLVAGPAAAANVRFMVTNAAEPGSVTWLLPASPIPTYAEDDFFFLLEGPVQGAFEDTVVGDGVVEFEFFTFVADGAGGGLNTIGFGAPGGLPFSIPFIFELLGDQLFTGPTAAPTFRLGDYTLREACACTGVGDFALTISAAGVPEPHAWTLAILGFGAAGAVLRHRRRHAPAG